MSKRNREFGPLYQHAKAELELAGVTQGKGNIDQKLMSTTLKLVDVLEKNSPTEFIKTTILNIFRVLSVGELLGKPTDNPDEWLPAEGLEGGILYNKRCDNYFSRDGGKTWFTAQGNYGISDKFGKDNDHGNQENI